MIEWMQTHRKWLVITIWVATIAFIGAGFVGWGQFNLASKSSTVAEINGNTEVSIQDVQEIYNNLFMDLNQKLGGKLDDATAEKLGLKQQAFKMAIEQGLLREYAKNLGLYVTDEEVAKAIIDTFKDTKTYKKYLQMNGLKAKEFEENLRKQLLVQKLTQALHLKPGKTETLSIASALYNADNISIRVINKNSVKVNINEDELKKFWEKNKDKYKSPEMYKIAIVKTPIKGVVTDKELKEYYENNKNEYKNENGEIIPFEKAVDKVKKDLLAKKSLRNAVLSYKKLKEGAKNYDLYTLPLNNNLIPSDKMQELINKGYLKPFIKDNFYISALLIEEIKPKPMPFQKARVYVLKDLLNIKTKDALINQAKYALKNFKGKNIGFVTKYDANKIKSLKPEEATEFLFNLFLSDKPKGFFLIPSQNPQKAVVYQITEQKLLDENKYKQNKAQIGILTENLLNSQAIDDLIKELMQKYHIKSYVK
ncbi:peptidyl-prolyl cis-trans isomerase D [Lebetimonas natsushimae]|uniref:Peptidyl-prolyl cis-trans isomerase D n=1 Tax=Lebetimonas natsushimae TaxID=1936991 RepID=A0A292YD08_9BACT|nr:SurA N-terminal domain-containing protein [Lebetimonas natsushimae]GAX87588.1 peptidyl-prolyl cis-trans isomerase D [Lebetimonas natsushimae]